MMTTFAPILLVDDEPQILKFAKLTLQGSGIQDVLTLEDSRQVMPLLATQDVAAIVLDLYMPLASGIELLPEITSNYPHIPVIVMTAADEAEVAVDCMKNGAFDYLVKPVEAGRLVSSIQKALERRCMSHEITTLKKYLFTDQLEHEAAFSAIVTQNKRMRGIFKYLEVLAGSRQPVLVTGETGVGKELVARAIHEVSGCAGEFVAVNLAGLDDAMFSDSLFGHKKGAYTGADQARDGLIAKAAGGTLFLDEIGDLNEPSQIKLLRLLQEKEYYPVGSDNIRKSDARIIVATNQELQKLITSGRFRKDLYYRLCSHQIHIPSLRERIEDIPLLLDHFLGEAAQSFDKRKPTAPPELVTLLSTYQFPGNVRELQALVFDAVARHSSGILSLETFKAVIGEVRSLSHDDAVPSQEKTSALVNIFGRFPTIDEVEEFLIAEAIHIAKGNQGIAASLLGMSRKTLNRRLKISNHPDP